MTAQQLRMTDIDPGIFPPPEVWDCMKSCRHCGEFMSHFPGSDRLRCDYGIFRDGMSGNDMYQKVIDNIVHIWCKYYEEK